MAASLPFILTIKRINLCILLFSLQLVNHVGRCVFDSALKSSTVQKQGTELSLTNGESETLKHFSTSMAGCCSKNSRKAINILLNSTPGGIKAEIRELLTEWPWFSKKLFSSPNHSSWLFWLHQNDLYCQAQVCTSLVSTRKSTRR